jgi:hypothetical protein
VIEAVAAGVLILGGVYSLLAWLAAVRVVGETVRASGEPFTAAQAALIIAAPLAVLVLIGRVGLGGRARGPGE